MFLLNAFFVSKGNLYRDYLLSSVQILFETGIRFGERNVLNTNTWAKDAVRFVSYLEFTLVISNLNNSNYCLSQTKV